MKKRLEQTQSALEKMIELTSVFPEDTMIKIKIKKELFKREKKMAKHLSELELFIDNLDKCEGEEDIEKLLSSPSTTPRQASSLGVMS